MASSLRSPVMLDSIAIGLNWAFGGCMGHGVYGFLVRDEKGRCRPDSNEISGMERPMEQGQ